MAPKEQAGREAKVAGTIRTNWLVESVRCPHQPEVPATYLFDVVDSTDEGAANQFLAQLVSATPTSHTLNDESDVRDSTAAALCKSSFRVAYW